MNKQLSKQGMQFPSLNNRTEVLTSFDRIFDNFFNTEFPSFIDTFGINVFEKHSYPKVDVYHTDNSVIIESEIPGMTKDNLKIKMKNDVLTICGEKRNQNASDDVKKYVYRELKHSSFCRSFKISDDQLDSKKITSTFEDGLLTINIPYKNKIETKDTDFEIEIK